MIKHLIIRITCQHRWKKTYNGQYVHSQYACVKCGKIAKKYFNEEGAWLVSREARGETFE